MPYIVLIALLLGNNASSNEYLSSTDIDTSWEREDIDECLYTMTNTDTVVLDNVTVLNGVLGFRVDWYTVSGFFGYVKVAETITLTLSLLGYNAFDNTATFNAGQLVFEFPNCEE